MQRQLVGPHGRSWGWSRVGVPLGVGVLRGAPRGGPHVLCSPRRSNPCPALHSQALGLHQCVHSPAHTGPTHGGGLGLGLGLCGWVCVGVWVGGGCVWVGGGCSQCWAGLQSTNRRHSTAVLPSLRTERLAPSSRVPIGPLAPPTPTLAWSVRVPQRHARVPRAKVGVSKQGDEGRDGDVVPPAAEHNGVAVVPRLEGRAAEGLLAAVVAAVVAGEVLCGRRVGEGRGAACWQSTWAHASSPPALTKPCPPAQPPPPLPTCTGVSIHTRAGRAARYRLRHAANDLRCVTKALTCAGLPSTPGVG